MSSRAVITSLQLPGQLRLFVKPTCLDSTSGSTTTWLTLLTNGGYINMLSVPKQHSRKRELPAVFEGNQPNEQQGPMTTFKNWVAEVRIYMSLEDHNLANMLEDVKTEGSDCRYELHRLLSTSTRTWSER
eukprot:6490644-Amphidinium_carterae.1